MLREQLSCLAMDLTPSPLRVITRIPTASFWVNIDGTAKPVIFAQVGHHHFGAWRQDYFGGKTKAMSVLQETKRFKPCIRPRTASRHVAAQARERPLAGSASLPR